MLSSVGRNEGPKIEHRSEETAWKFMIRLSIWPPTSGLGLGLDLQYVDGSIILQLGGNVT